MKIRILNIQVNKSRIKTYQHLSVIIISIDKVSNHPLLSELKEKFRDRWYIYINQLDIYLQKTKE